VLRNILNCLDQPGLTELERTYLISARESGLYRKLIVLKLSIHLTGDPIPVEMPYFPEWDDVFAFPPHDQFFSAIGVEELPTLVTGWLAESAKPASSFDIHARLDRIEVQLEKFATLAPLGGNLRQAFSYSMIGLNEAATKCRRLAESIAKRIYESLQGKPHRGRFVEVINLLEQQPRDIIPMTVIAYLRGAQTLGNLAAHADELDSSVLKPEDVEASLLQTLNLVEWYLFAFLANHPGPAKPIDLA
jgi:hypothetical protein